MGEDIYEEFERAADGLIYNFYEPDVFCKLENSLPWKQLLTPDLVIYMNTPDICCAPGCNCCQA